MPTPKLEIFTITIAKRTEKTITTDQGKSYRPKVATNYDGQTVERVNAGNWSMAHGWDATDYKPLLRDWEQETVAAPEKSHEQKIDEALFTLGTIVHDIEDIHELPQHTPTAKATTTCPPVARWGNVIPIGAVRSGASTPARIDMPPVIMFPVEDSTAFAPHASFSEVVEPLEPPAPPAPP